MDGSFTVDGSPIVAPPAGRSPVISNAGPAAEIPSGSVAGGRSDSATNSARPPASNDTSATNSPAAAGTGNADGDGGGELTDDWVSVIAGAAWRGEESPQLAAVIANTEAVASARQRSTNRVDTNNGYSRRRPTDASSTKEPARR